MIESWLLMNRFNFKSCFFIVRFIWCWLGCKYLKEVKRRKKCTGKMVYIGTCFPNLLEQTEQEDMPTIITRRRWRWTGHVLRKDINDITWTALRWTPEGRRKRGHPKTTWRRTVEKELKELIYSWSSIDKLAKDRQGWRNVVAALCATRHNGQWVSQTALVCVQ